MANIAGLSISLTAKTRDFTKGMRGARKTVDRFVSGAAQMARRLATMGAAAVAFASAIGTVMVRAQMKVIDMLAKTADKLGITTEGLAGLEHAASITGVEKEKLSKGLQYLSRNISEFAHGTGEAKEAFKLLKLDAKMLLGLPLEQQFLAVAKAMGNVKNQSDKISIAMDIFGRGGADLLNTLALGETGLRDMMREADALGLSLSRIDAKQVEEANDAITRMTGAFEGIKRSITVALAPYIEYVAKKIKEWTLEANGFRTTIKAVIDGVGTGFGFMAKWIMKIRAGFKLLKAEWQLFGAAWVRITYDAVSNVIAAFNLLPKINITKPEWLENLRGISDAMAEAAGATKREALNISKRADDIGDKFKVKWGQVAEDAKKSAQQQIKIQNRVTDNQLQSLDKIIKKEKEERGEFQQFTRGTLGMALLPGPEQSIPAANRMQTVKDKQLEETNRTLFRIERNTREPIAVAG